MEVASHNVLKMKAWPWLAAESDLYHCWNLCPMCPVLKFHVLFYPSSCESQIYIYADTNHGIRGARCSSADQCMCTQDNYVLGKTKKKQWVRNGLFRLSKICAN